MARFRKVDPRMWGDEKFRSLSKPQPNAQTLWQYLLTGPHTKGCPGLYNIGMAALAENLGWTLERFRIPFQELLNKGMMKYDSNVHVILLPKAINYDPPDNPNVIKYWGKLYDEIPDCKLKSEFYYILKRYIEGLPKGLLERFMIPFNERYRDSLALALTLTIPEPEPLPEPLPEPKEKESNSESDGFKTRHSPNQKNKVNLYKEKNPQIKTFLDFYFQEFKGRFQIDPIIEGGKDGTLIKTLLGKIDFNELKILLIDFLDSDDPFIQKSGYTIGAFKSQIQKLRIKPVPGGKSFRAANIWLRKEEARDAEQGRQKKISYGINKDESKSPRDEF